MADRRHLRDIALVAVYRMLFIAALALLPIANDAAAPTPYCCDDVAAPTPFDADDVAARPAPDEHHFERRRVRPSRARAPAGSVCEDGPMSAVTEHGPLPRLLIGLTVVTGLVDAFNYVALGHVFVANMTGNVVFFGFALAGVGEVSVVASLLAVIAFTAGAALGGRLAREPRPHRGFLLAVACLVQAAPVLASAVVVTVAGTEPMLTRLVLVALLAAAMGGQNAVVRRLGVPDLTTTVLTLTVTGLVADTSPPPVRFRRVLAVLAMVLGALTGGVLLRWVATSAPLWLATALLLSCAAGAYASARPPRSAAWR
jgi:uncharacterized membrane protein YoaK (UPF0700 family)